MDLQIFKNHLLKYLSNDEINDLIESFDEEENHSLVINPKKINIDKLEKYFPNLENHPFIKNVYYFNKSNELGKHFLFDNGAYYIMDASSLLISHFLKLEDNVNVLDMCSAPGGKSISLALKNPNINIISNDLSFKRLLETEKNIERLGLSNITLINNDFKNVFQYYKNSFDIIILDAPCSGSGMFRKNDLVKEDWSLNKVLSLAKTQKELIEYAYYMLKNGGLLVYSTCSFSYEENEEVLISILNNHDDLKLIDLPHIDGEYRSKNFKEAIHLFPNLYKGEGFFLSFIRKSNNENNKTFKIKNIKPKQYLPNYTLNFNNEIISKNKIYNTNNTIDLSHFNVIKYGLEIGEINKNIFTPSFHLAHYLDSTNSIKLNEEEKNQYIHGDTLINKNNLKSGYYIASYDGINLGFVKATNNQLKNFYPKGLRH